MAVNYATGVKNSRMTVVRDAIDAGAGAGILEIGTAGMAQVLATITLNDPSGTISAGVLTLSGFPKTATAGATGTAAAARIRDSTNADVVTGLTVGTSGTDIVLAGTAAITSGQTVQINSASITHAA